MARTDTTSLQLAKSTLIRLSRTAREIRCESGSVWITLDGDPRDIVLEAGQQFRRDDGNTPTIVYALEPARLTVGHAQAAIGSTTAAPARRPRTGLAARALALD